MYASRKHLMQVWGFLLHGLKLVDQVRRPWKKKIKKTRQGHPARKTRQGVTKIKPGEIVLKTSSDVSTPLDLLKI